MTARATVSAWLKHGMITVTLSILLIMELVDWQIYDNQNGLVFPWFTHPMLKCLRGWDLAGKTVLEYGSGLSTVWWAKEAKYVVSVETKIDWVHRITDELVKAQVESKAQVIWCPCPVSEADFSKAEWYVNVYQNTGVSDFDIVVVDDIFRDECMRKGIELLSRRGGILIADNWQQDRIWISQQMVDLMAPYEGEIFVQSNHTDHEGNPWKTAYWKIPPQVLQT